MEPKALPPARISAIKLFNKSSLAIRPNKINVSSLKKEDTDQETSGQIVVIKKQVIQIRDLITTNTLLKAKEEEQKRKEREKEEFAEKEEKIEKPKGEGGEKAKLPSLPKLSFLDRIKKFLFNILLGFIVYRLVPHLPKLLEIAKVAGQALDFLTDWGGRLLNGLVTFIDWGYKAYDNTRAFLKNLGGENFVKVFDGFIGAMDKVIEASIIAMIAFGELRGREDGSKPGKPKVTKSGGRPVGRPGPKVTTGGGGGKFKLPKGIKSKGGLLGLMFLIPDLIDSGMLISQGRGKDGLRTLLSAVAGVGAGIAAVAGVSATAATLGITGVGLPAAIALAVSGFAASSLAGSAAYDLADAGLRKIGLVDKDPKTGKPYQYASGGPVTRSGKIIGGSVKREINKSTVKRQININPTELKPGSAVGGDKEIQKVFPESKKSDTIDPLGYTKTFYDKTTEIPFFGPIFGIATKALLGDKPSPLDYENVGRGINSWMSNTFSGEVLRTGGAFAEGGEVNAEMFMRGEDLTKVIAKSVEESVSSRLSDTMNELQKQLTLREIDRGRKPGETTPGAEDEPTGSPTLTGNTNAEKVFRYLVDKEGFTPEAAAGVIGNLMQESGVNPKSRQYGGGPGRGIMQWTESERWSSLSAWANNSGKDPWALETQVEWMIKEMKSYGTYNRIKGVSSYKRAVEIFEKEMERAGTPNYPRRYQFAADALASFSGGAGGGNISLGASKVSAVDQFTPIAKQFGLQMTSDYRPGDSGYHGKNRARDYSNDSVGRGTSQQLAFAKHLVQNYGSSLAQLIYTPLGFGIANGKKVGLDYWGESTNSQHYHHVHVAYGRGGLVRGFTKAILGERGPEFVLDTDTTLALEQNFPGFLSALNKANYDGAIEVLKNYADYEKFPVEVVVDQPQPQAIPMIVHVPMSGQSYSESSDGDNFFDGIYDRG